jgi:hypothetical protein
MEKHHGAADHVLCVVSAQYLKAAYSMLEHNAALWRAVREPSSFLLYVVVRPCALPALTAHMRRCDLFNLPEAAARQRFKDYIKAPAPPDAIVFPSQVSAESNIAIRVPMHFMGRDAAMAGTEAALTRNQGRVAIAALHGMRGLPPMRKSTGTTTAPPGGSGRKPPTRSAPISHRSVTGSAGSGMA